MPIREKTVAQIRRYSRIWSSFISGHFIDDVFSKVKREQPVEEFDDLVLRNAVDDIADGGGHNKGKDADGYRVDEEFGRESFFQHLPDDKKKKGDSDGIDVFVSEKEDKKEHEKVGMNTDRPQPVQQFHSSLPFWVTRCANVPLIAYN